MSHTPTSSTPGNASGAAAKPTLAGVRIRQRKGQAKATAKNEPEVFREKLLLHLALVPTPPTTDALVAKLVEAGTTLELLKYSGELFEILFLGGLLQAGGEYLDDVRSPVYLLQHKDESLGDWDPVKGMVDVIHRVSQRYRYLQRPLEDSFLPLLIGYLNKLDETQRANLAEAIARLVVEMQIAPKFLPALSKEHIVKEGISLSFITQFFRAYLQRQSIGNLVSLLNKSEFKDLLLVFPNNKRTKAELDAHFKKENLPKVAEWYAGITLSKKRQETVLAITDMLNNDDSDAHIIETLQEKQVEDPTTEADLVEWIWFGFVGAAGPEKMNPTDVVNQFVQLVGQRAPILEPFTSSAKAQIHLLNTIQVYCHEETRLLTAFPQLVKVLYNADCLEDQAIIYWFDKGAKPNGKQHFLKVTKPLVDFLREQSDDEDDE